VTLQDTTHIIYFHFYLSNEHNINAISLRHCPPNQIMNNDRIHLADEPSPDDRGTNLLTAMKLVAASVLFYSAGTSVAQTYHQQRTPANAYQTTSSRESFASPSNNAYEFHSPRRSNVDGGSSHRRLSASDPPSYMEDLMDDLKARKKLMEETPPEEVKYWFEYTGPLQVSFVNLV
jgi:hypothetical protein